ncbi:restriction endonuclease subunit S [Paenibacillus sp. FSL R5-0912]|uniref:restriction endonuclease subunit S n=1 Tax=Paenibacillus sp. FSL R5-0912 TaxID=1536771 RepID=UPI000694F86B|nr:restriction endonuclease subunit S [Paenibacillus sp. FSL R5-0912]
MKSNYKRLGDYIHKVDNRNTALLVDKLWGLSMTKEFRETTSNTVGTDMSLYKVMSKWQFACDFMSVIRVNKLPVVLKTDDEPNLVSPAYPVFEVNDINALHPEYLMMWFSRPEFDRYAVFKCDSAIRGGFDWEELCDTSLPVPPITKQKEVVKEYKVLVDRINLNNRVIQNLEETAQAIYKQWFIDFEFPDNNGKPYRSYGGKMVESELGDVPKDWEVISIKELCVEMKSGGTPSRDNVEYWDSRDVPWLKTGEVSNKVLVEAEEYISFKGLKNSSAKILPINSVLIAMYGEGRTKGQVGYLKFEASTNQACCAMICENEYISSYLYYYLLINRDEISNMANGGAQPNLSKALIEELRIIKPTRELLLRHPFIKILNSIESITRENISLEKIKGLLLSKLATMEDKL